ncbi:MULTISPECIES: hypothetical protein [Streptomyces]|uniref:Uncharacterized protein n=2 Tax=Streptomyces TaxID=1883 RepID=A0ABV9IM80_9ACTN
MAAGHRRLSTATRWWPQISADGVALGTDGDFVELTTIPCCTWANRQDGSMRLRLPTS